MAQHVEARRWRTAQKDIKRLRCFSAIAFFMVFAPRATLAQDQQRQVMRVAAASDLQPAMRVLVSQYESESQNRVEVAYGSSGNFFAQIRNGAPFDLFFSADIEYPRKLEVAGFAEPRTLYTYAVGEIVLWAPPGANVHVAKQQWKALLEPSVHKIAIASPAHAPYGRAAVAALQKAGVYDQVQAKLVYGENISQAAQFVQSGNAQVGILAKSLALSPAMSGGESWDVPAGLYPPIEQAAIVLKNGANQEAARSFLDFVKSEAGRAILAKFGFAFAPSSTAAAKSR